VRFPLSLRNMEDLLFERGIDICDETVRLWWNPFGPLFAGDILSRGRARKRLPRVKTDGLLNGHCDLDRCLRRLGLA
jgi:transposase-like protein